MTSTYRVAWREMAATTGYRTLYPAIIPPGSMHVHAINSCGPVDSIEGMLAATTASSILSDFFVRSTGSSHLPSSSFESLPVLNDSELSRKAVYLYLRLNCLTEIYGPLWHTMTGEDWNVEVPIRNGLQRRIAQSEIDTIVALEFGISLDELQTIYRTQFPVMNRYDQETIFDANGRIVPKPQIQDALQHSKIPVKGGEAITLTHPESKRAYSLIPPFTTFDRESALREAYAQMSKE